MTTAHRHRDIDLVVDYVVGEYFDLHKAAEKFDVSVDEFHEMCVKAKLDLCSDCGRWFHKKDVTYRLDAHMVYCKECAKEIRDYRKWEKQNPGHENL